MLDTIIQTEGTGGDYGRIVNGLVLKNPREVDFVGTVYENGEWKHDQPHTGPLKDGEIWMNVRVEPGGDHPEISVKWKMKHKIMHIKEEKEVTRIAKLERETGTWRDHSTAAGCYQFLIATWKELKMSDFTKTGQDTAAIELLKKSVMAGHLKFGNVKAAIHRGALKWASFPNEADVSHFEHQKAIPVRKVISIYRDALDIRTSSL